MVQRLLGPPVFRELEETREGKSQPRPQIPPHPGLLTGAFPSPMGMDPGLPPMPWGQAVLAGPRVPDSKV